MGDRAPGLCRGGGEEEEETEPGDLTRYQETWENVAGGDGRAPPHHWADEQEEDIGDLFHQSDAGLENEAPQTQAP